MDLRDLLHKQIFCFYHERSFALREIGFGPTSLLTRCADALRRVFFNLARGRSQRHSTLPVTDQTRLHALVGRRASSSPRCTYRLRLLARQANRKKNSTSAWSLFHATLGRALPSSPKKIPRKILPPLFRPS